MVRRKLGARLAGREGDELIDDALPPALHHTRRRPTRQRQRCELQFPHRSGAPPGADRPTTLRPYMSGDVLGVLGRIHVDLLKVSLVSRRRVDVDDRPPGGPIQLLERRIQALDDGVLPVSLGLRRLRRRSLVRQLDLLQSPLEFGDAHGHQLLHEVRQDCVGEAHDLTRTRPCRIGRLDCLPKGARNVVGVLIGEQFLYAAVLQDLRGQGGAAAQVFDDDLVDLSANLRCLGAGF